MKARKNALWTDDDNRRLAEAVETGVSPSRAAVMFKRSVNSVQGQARKIGKPFRTILDERRVREAKIETATPKEGLRANWSSKVP